MAQGCVDLVLPDIHEGHAVCESLRQQGSTIPILMLTAPDRLEDRVRGLKLGADDSENLETYEFGIIRVDFKRKQVQRDGTPLLMLPLEYKLLCYFIRHRDMTLTRHRLLDDVWRYDQAPTTRTVDVHVAGIRQKIELDPRHPRHLLTIHRRGYKFIG